MRASRYPAARSPMRQECTLVPVRWPCLLLLPIAVVACSAPCAGAATPAPTPTGLETLERQVEEFTLANGLRFMLVERHDAPVFSFQTVVDAGSADNAPGTTGLAH